MAADQPLHLFPALLRSSDSIRSIFQSVFRTILRPRPSTALVLLFIILTTALHCPAGLPPIDLNYRPIKPIKLIVEAIPSLLCYVA